MVYFLVSRSNNYCVVLAIQFRFFVTFQIKINILILKVAEYNFSLISSARIIKQKRLELSLPTLQIIKIHMVCKINHKNVETSQSVLFLRVYRSL